MRSFAVLFACIVTGLAVTGCGDEPRADASQDAGLPAQSRGGDPRTLTLTVVAIEARIGRDRVRSSGTVIDAGRGLVLTSAHTLWGARSLRLATGVGVLLGRIVARAPCADLALVETQPRLPGLVPLSPNKALAPPPGERLTVVGRSWADADAGSYSMLTIPASPETAGRPVRIDPGLPRLHGAMRLNAMVPEASGGPIVDERNRLVAMGLAAGDRGGALAAAAMPASTIARLLGELRQGSERLYRGWYRHYRCAPQLNAYARAAHPGFRPSDARLSAPVPATRLPGTDELNR